MNQSRETPLTESTCLVLSPNRHCAVGSRLAPQKGEMGGTRLLSSSAAVFLKMPREFLSRFAPCLESGPSASGLSRLDEILNGLAELPQQTLALLALGFI